MEDLLRLVVDENASDLHLSVGAPPAVRLGGRLVTVVVEGEVSAVTAALEAGKNAAAEVGNVKVCEVIARPHPDVMKFLTTD